MKSRRVFKTTIHRVSQEGITASLKLGKSPAMIPGQIPIALYMVKGKSTAI